MSDWYIIIFSVIFNELFVYALLVSGFTNWICIEICPGLCPFENIGSENPTRGEDPALHKIGWIQIYLDQDLCVKSVTICRSSF